MSSVLNFFVLFYAFVFVYADAGATCEKSITTVTSSFRQYGTICKGQLIFEEYFNVLNQSLWTSEQTLGGGGNNEFQWYTNDDKNRFVKNGKLYICPTLTVDKIGEYDLAHGNITLAGCTDPDPSNCHWEATPERINKPICSARLNTAASFSFKFGRVEVYAKTPTGDWLWPAIWFLPRNETYGGWPRSGEIDLMESRGNRKYDDGYGNEMGVELMESTLHFGPNADADAFLTSTFSINNSSGFNNGFHKYELIWDDKGIRFLVDGNEIGYIPVGDGFWKRGGFLGDDIWKYRTKMAPFDIEYYFILNLAVGGNNFFPDTGINQDGDKPWSNDDLAGACTRFWEGRSQWLDGWKLNQNNGEDACLVIDLIRLWAV